MDQFYPEYRLVKAQDEWEAQIRLVDNTVFYTGCDLTTKWHTFKRSNDKEICESAIQRSIAIDKRFTER